LRYGNQPAARLTSHPKLYYREDELYLREGTRRIPIQGNYLSVRRDVNELQAVQATAAEYLRDADRPVLALQDGTLIRWALAGADAFVLRHFLDQYFDALDALRQQRVPVASYISRPRSTEVMGVVRLMFCPDVHVDAGQGARCTACSDERAGRTPGCYICNEFDDSDLFVAQLAEGQRGPLFLSLSDIAVKEYRARGHQIYFFYLRVGRELARIELPEWVATDAAQVDCVHSLVYDQCMRGQGYPVALARAHEQAVVRVGDRRAFERMVTSSLQRAELPTATSQKSASKQHPAL
jgi:hypothetical protein